MKSIILAGGQGTRLRPYTDDRPKCMVEYKNKPIIKYIIEVLKNNNITDISVVTGYKKEVLENYLKDENINFYTNENFDKTNMVSTFFCAEKEFEDDIIISYSDIIYNEKVIQNLLSSNSDLSIIVDKEWYSLWSIRMDNPLEDAESMKVNNEGFITELGKKTNNYENIQGQYIGLIKISKNLIKKVQAFYKSLDKSKIYDGKDFDNMYMTSFLQLIIEQLEPAKAVFINGGWMEIDSVEDLEKYQKINYDVFI